MRTFSDPDPMTRLVDEEGIPLVFWRLPQETRGRRIRLYLIAEAAQGPHYPIVLWNIALDMTPEGEAYARMVVDQHSDAAIEEMVADGRRRWKGYEQALADGTVDTSLLDEARGRS